MASAKALAAIALTLIVAVPICLGFGFASETVEYQKWETEENVNLSNAILNNEYPIYLDYSGTTNNTTLLDGVIAYKKISTTPTAYPMQTITSHSITFQEDTWVGLSAYSYWEIRGSGLISYKLNGIESADYSKAGDWLISGNGGSIKFSNAHTFTLLSYTNDGRYADISAGWGLPLANQYYAWTNNQINETVKILIDLPLDSRTNLAGSSFAITRSSAGLVTLSEYGPQPPYPLAQTKDLGNYQYVLAERTTTGWKVSGLSAWPGIGTPYQTYNTVTLDFISNTQPATFETLALRTNNTDTTLRVESATVLSGSFPSTKDFTLDMEGLFPGKSFTAKINSVGIYGDTLTVGSNSFTVTNGRITVEGDTVPLKGAIISSRSNGSTYDLYISGHKLASTSGPASIGFGGEWSLTITAQILKQVSGESSEWDAGGFAFDKDSFVGVIVMVAAFVFIGVGLYGARSGLKAGLLLMVCGGAALIALTTI